MPNGLLLPPRNPNPLSQLPTVSHIASKSAQHSPCYKHAHILFRNPLNPIVYSQLIWLSTLHTRYFRPSAEQTRIRTRRPVAHQHPSELRTVYEAIKPHNPPRSDRTRR
jgi:hypothetical protein